MPAYNAEKYIQEAIDSILNQSYANFELLIFDDGSSDTTRDIINSISDERIKKIYAETNQGVIEARNQLIGIANGKYIALMDADDVALNTRFEKQVTFLEADCGDVCGSEQWNLNQVTGKLKPSRDRHTDADLRALLSVYCTMCNSAVMARAEIIKKFKYDASMQQAEDYYLWVQLAAAGYRFANLRERLITYRQYPEQSSLKHTQNFRTATLQVMGRYLEKLCIPIDLLPINTPWPKRVQKAWNFLNLMNSRIPGISYGANCEMYARFQFKGNLFTSLLNKIERWFIAMLIKLRS